MTVAGRPPHRVSDRPGVAEALETCFAPVATARFLTEYHERRPLVIRRNEPGRFDELLSARTVDELIGSGSLRYPAFRLVKAGARLDLSDYTVDIPWRPVPFARTLDVERVVAEFAAGATIVLQGLHHNHPPLAHFCRSLEEGLGHSAQANAYYTPRSSQGLGVHHDTHDVVCLQVSGQKRWVIYEPVLELPLKDQRYSAEMGQPGRPYEDVVLRAGDTLYLPRGWLHEALTSRTDSLHLTIGLNVHTWTDALRAALDDCGGDLAFRRSVPEDGAMTDDLLAILAERLRPGEVARRRRERLVDTRRPIRDRPLWQLRALDRLTSATPVERNQATIADFDPSSDPVRLAFEGKEMLFPAYVAKDLEYIVGTKGWFTGLDLPGKLDEVGRIVLLARLVRDGFLRVVEL